jgi:predicted nuclease with TOPRIM domain
LIDGGLRHLPGGVEEYLTLRRDGAQAEGKTARASQQTATSSRRGATRRQEVAVQRAAIKELAAVERRLAKIPQEIHEVNTRIAEHDQRDYMGVAAHIEALNSLESKLSDLETRWLELTEQLEGTTGGSARASSNAEY